MWGHAVPIAHVTVLQDWRNHLGVFGVSPLILVFSWLILWMILWIPHGITPTDPLPSSVYFNFKSHQLLPAHYRSDWLIPLFLDHLDINTCMHVWDILLLEGDTFLFRAALALLAVLEPRLFFLEWKELLELLQWVCTALIILSLNTDFLSYLAWNRGENKVVLEVARLEQVPTDGPKYMIYGIDEDMLWDKIESMDGWWKETTWKRLVLRELPDTWQPEFDMGEVEINGSSASPFDLLSVGHCHIFVLRCRVFTHVSVWPWAGAQGYNALPGRYVHPKRKIRIERLRYPEC